jgi:hypothetical protein
MIPEDENKPEGSNVLRNIVVAFFFMIFVVLFLKVVFF